MPEDWISIPEIMNHPWFAKETSFELNSTISRKECNSNLNGNGIISDAADTRTNINFVNVDNLFLGENYDEKLSYEDYVSVTEDLATMAVNENVLDELEKFGYNRKEVKESLAKGDLNHATASYNLLMYS